jgi:hypothetical protein
MCVGRVNIVFRQRELPAIQLVRGVFFFEPNMIRQFGKMILSFILFLESFIEVYPLLKWKVLCQWSSLIHSHKKKKKNTLT